jgi:uncharacterized membrane protein
MITLDFFASAAAICAVVLLTKFVTHRTRHDLATVAVLVLHGLCVALAALGLVAALVGTETESNWTFLHVLVWVGTLGSMALLLADALWSDLVKRGRRARSQTIESSRPDVPRV